MPLPECDKLAVESVGGKARTLGRLMSTGLPVPDGFCLRAELFAYVRTECGLDDLIERELSGAADRPATLGTALANIRRGIRTAEMPPGVSGELEAIFLRRLESGTQVVRSSSPVEDGFAGSGAGIYDSVLNVDTPLALWEAVRTVWSSLFTERVNFYRAGNFDRRMAVVIQDQIAADRTGVFVTRHPLTGAEELYSETGDSADAVTAGLSGVATTPTAALRTVAAQAERIVGGPADVEFAVSDGRVVVLQARPVVSAAPPQITGIEWAVQEDVEAVRALPLGGCEPLLARQLVKHVPYRKICRALGIRIFDIYYLCYRWDSLRTTEMAEFLAHIDTDRVLLNWGGGFKQTSNRAEVVAELRSGRGNNQVADGTSCVQVGTVVPAVGTGLAALAADGDILVEAFPADTRGLKSGAVPPTTYVLAPDGSVRSVVPASLTLGTEALAELAAITVRLADRLGEVRVEWYLAPDGLYVKDLSIERDELTSAVTMLSPGVAGGPALPVPDLTGIEETTVTDRISVTEHTGHEEVIRDAPRLRTLLAAIRASPERPVVVAAYPSLGLVPLIPYVAGFVFEHGNLLCHTAIVLRERRVPACVRPGALAELAAGQRIVLGPTGVLSRTE